MLSISNVGGAFCDILLKEYGVEDNLTNNYRRRNLKRIILDKILHAKITPQTNPSKPHLIQSTLLEADVLDQVMRNTNDINADIECLFKAAKIIRKCILNFRKDNVVSFEEGVSDTDRNIPAVEKTGTFCR